MVHFQYVGGYYEITINGNETTDLIVHGWNALCAEHDRKVRGPRVHTCHIVFGRCINADLHLKNLHLIASISKTIICSLA